MPKFKISVMRYKDMNYKEVIDKILIGCNMTFAEAVRALGKFAMESGFEEHFVKTVQRNARRQHKLSSSSYEYTCIVIPNLHGFLGPGGYLMEKDEG